MKKYPIVSMSLALFINLAADRITKLWAIRELMGEPEKSFLGGLLILKYAENSGAFLSMGRLWPMPVKYLVFIILPILVCCGILVYAFFKEKNLIKIILLTSFVAGGLGNLVDRLMNNFRVVDFLNFGIGRLRTGILNVADLSITFAAVLLVLYEGLGKGGARPERPDKANHVDVAGPGF